MTEHRHNIDVEPRYNQDDEFLIIQAIKESSNVSKHRHPQY